MDHLSSLDASFLHLETPAVPMHAGCVMLLDVPDARRTGFLDELQRTMVARMQVEPVFSRKLQAVPFGFANPVWDTEENVDLDHHVRSHTLPSPGGMRELERYVEAEHARLLDRARPLWELHLVDGLADGKLALYAKVHHAAIGGIGAGAILKCLADGVHSASPAHPVRAPGEARPGALALLAASVTHSMGQALGLVRHVPDAMRSIAAMQGKLPSAAPRTVFNASITAERAFSTLQFPLGELTVAARVFAGTVNDVLLAMVGGALRRYLEGGKGLPAQSLVAAVPVNLREREGGEVHNQFSLWRTELATNVPDVAARMRAIVAHTRDMRANIAALRPLALTDFPGIGAPWLMGGAAVAVEFTGLANALPPAANVVVSEVPGPAQPPYIAGARVLASYPVSIVMHGLALNVTAQSCCDRLNVGIVAAASAVPDLQRFSACLREAHKDLVAAAHAHDPHAASAPIVTGDAATDAGSHASPRTGAGDAVDRAPPRTNGRSRSKGA
ncbi:MAG TPA: wax ester/triacylglycerol synthase family O-acyltransferase [Telluria sp.]|nr:wax ester/triacylglycerol synthase family O-acyltransferase [Telluria sp.]